MGTGIELIWGTEQFATGKFFSKSKGGQIGGKTTETLKGINEQASKRDQMLDQFKPGWGLQIADC